MSMLSRPLLFEYSAWGMHLSFKNKYFLSVYSMSDCSRTLKVHRSTACDVTLIYITRGGRWEQREKDLEGSLERQTLHSNLCVLQVLEFSSKCFPGGSEGKASACNVRNLGLIPGLGRSSREGNGNPLQYSCLENPMDREAFDHLMVGYSP